MMKKKEYCSIGIMSGTSLDGLDFSLIKTDGINKIKVLFNDYYKFNQKLKSNIKKLIKKINKIEKDVVLDSDEFFELIKNLPITFVIKQTIFLEIPQILSLFLYQETHLLLLQCQDLNNYNLFFKYNFKSEKRFLEFRN